MRVTRVANSSQPSTVRWRNAFVMKLSHACSGCLPCCLIRSWRLKTNARTSRIRLLFKRATLIVSFAALLPAWTLFAQAIDVWTVGVDNTRQGWNRFETVLTPANVPRLKKTREFMVDEKIDVSPLVV